MSFKDLLKPFSIATALGVASVLAVWFLTTLLNVDLTVQPFNRPIPVSVFVTFSVIGGVGALVVSWVLTKTSKPKRNGQIIGWIVLLGSIATPLSGTSDPVAIFWIQATHFAIGIPLLMAMAKHLPESK